MINTLEEKKTEITLPRTSICFSSLITFLEAGSKSPVTQRKNKTNKKITKIKKNCQNFFDLANLFFAKAKKPIGRKTNFNFIKFGFNLHRTNLMHSHLIYLERKNMAEWNNTAKDDKTKFIWTQIFKIQFLTKKIFVLLFFQKCLIRNIVN